VVKDSNSKNIVDIHADIIVHPYKKCTIYYSTVYIIYSTHINICVLAQCIIYTPTSRNNVIIKHIDHATVAVIFVTGSMNSTVDNDCLQQALDLAQEVVVAMSCPEGSSDISESRESGVIGLFEKHAKSPKNLSIIWKTFRGTLFQMHHSYDAVVTWIENGRNIVSKTMVANLLGLHEASVSNGLVEEFFTSQLVMPTEDIKAALHNKSKIIKQAYKHRQRVQVRPYSKTLVTLVIEALRKEGKITLSVESFHNDTAFAYLCGINKEGTPMKGPLAPSCIHPEDITGFLLELDTLLAAKRDDKNRTLRKGKRALQKKKLMKADVIGAMRKHFGLQEEKKAVPRTSASRLRSCTRKKEVAESADKSQNAGDNSKASTTTERHKSKTSDAHCKRKRVGSIANTTDESENACDDEKNNMSNEGGNDTATVTSNVRGLDPQKGCQGIKMNNNLASCRCRHQCHCSTESTDPKDESQLPLPKKGPNWEKQLLLHGYEPNARVLTEYPPSVMLQAISLVFPEIVRLLNEKGCALDELLISGRQGRQRLQLAKLPKKKTTLKATCSPVTSKDIKDVFLEGTRKGEKIFLVSPMIISIEGVFNQDFKEKYLDAVDELRFCKDKSGKGKSSNRASIYRPDECVDNEDRIFMADAEDRMLPLIKLGLINAIQAVEATELESILHEIQTELSNLFIDAVNETIESISGVGDLSVTPRWKERFDKIGSCENYGNDQTKDDLEEAGAAALDGMDIEDNDSCSEDSDSSSENSDSSSENSDSRRKRRKYPRTKVGRRGRNRSGVPRDLRSCRRKGCAGTYARSPQKRGRRQALATKSSTGLSRVQKFYAALLSKSFFGCGKKRKICRKIPRFKCNIIIAKCGTEASYGDHQDGSDILNSDTLQFATCLGENGKHKRRLPTTGELFVPTIVLGREGYTVRTKLVHRRGEHVLSSTSTGNNSAHLQSPGCNSFGIYHGSSLLKVKGVKKQGAHLSRCVFTGRDGVDPKKDPEIYKERICGDGLSHSAIQKGLRAVHVYNAYDTCNVSKTRVDIARATEGCGGVPLWCYDHEDNDNGQLSSPSDTKHAVCPPEKFSMLSTDDWEDFFAESLDVNEICGNDEVDDNHARTTIRGLKKPPCTIGMNQPKDKAAVVCNYKTAEYFLKAGKINHLLDTEGNTLSIQPIHTDRNTGRPLHIGKEVKRDEIPLTFTAYSKDTIDPKYPNIFVLHHPYKNDPNAIDMHIEFYEKLRDKMAARVDLQKRLQEAACRILKNKLHQQLDENDNTTLKELCKDYKNLPPLVVCGSGGSGNKAGDSGPSANIRSDDCTYTIGEHQSPAGPENIAMNLCMDRKNAIALMVDLEAWRRPRRRNGHSAPAEISDEDDVDDDENNESDEEDIEQGYNFIEEDDGEADITHNDDVMAGLDDEEANDHFFFMNYFVVKDAKKKKLQPWEIEQRFSRLPGYPSKEQKYLSYLVHDHYEFTLETAFDFETVVDFFEREKYTDMQVVHDGPIRFDAGDIQRFSFESYCGNDQRNESSLQRMFPKQPAEHAPENWVGRCQVIDYLKQQKIEAFERAIGSKPLGDTVVKRDRRYRVDPDELIPVMVAMMSAASLRFDKTASTMEIGKKKVAVIPPTAVGADLLPQEMRRSAKPCPNPDADVMTCYFRKEASNFLRSKNFQSMGEKFHSTFEVPDLRDHHNSKAIGECLLMALVSRFTGKVTMLSQFTEWAKNRRDGNDPHGGRSLPTSDAVGDFIEFLNSNKGTSLTPFVSDQHPKLLPKAFQNKRTGKKNFCKFLKRFSNEANEEGLSCVVSYLQHAAMEDKMNRRNLRDIIGMAVNACSSVQICRNLDFLAHKAISDVESVFPGFAGEVDTSSIGFGSGSRLGLRILTRDLDKKSDAGRLDWVFKQVTEGLECVHEDVLLAMGYKRHDGRVVSWLSGRAFSKTDVEHWCCKVYICMNSCHPSRTVSKKPLHRPHCWPLPVSGTWIEVLEDKFSEVWDAFMRLEPDYLERNYPQQLCFQSA